MSCTGDSGGFGGETKKDNRPFFKTFATLAIPNITMTPGLDEVQQAVNKVGCRILIHYFQTNLEHNILMPLKLIKFLHWLWQMTLLFFITMY